MKRTPSLRMHRFTVVIEADETGGYYAFCPALPGCYSQGETFEETKTNITEAIQCHLEGLLKAGKSLQQEQEEVVDSIYVPLLTAHGQAPTAALTPEAKQAALRILRTRTRLRLPRGETAASVVRKMRDSRY